MSIWLFIIDVHIELCRVFKQHVLFIMYIKPSPLVCDMLYSFHIDRTGVYVIMWVLQIENT